MGGPHECKGIQNRFRAKPRGALKNTANGTEDLSTQDGLLHQGGGGKRNYEDPAILNRQTPARRRSRIH